MADFYKCCWMWIHQGHAANVVVFRHFLIGILVCHRLNVSDQSQRANSKEPMQIRASESAGLVQAMGFKWIICNTEFSSRRAADCQRRHPASFGTACADPSNIRSLSLTARSDPSAGSQDQSGRHICQDNEDPFPSQETVSALVRCHAMQGGGWRRWGHNQTFLLGFFANTVLRRSVLVLYFIENNLISHRI